MSSLSRLVAVLLTPALLPGGVTAPLPLLAQADPPRRVVVRPSRTPQAPARQTVPAATEGVTTTASSAGTLVPSKTTGLALARSDRRIPIRKEPYHTPTRYNPTFVTTPVPLAFHVPEQDTSAIERFDRIPPGDRERSWRAAGLLGLVPLLAAFNSRGSDGDRGGQSPIVIVPPPITPPPITPPPTTTPPPETPPPTNPPPTNPPPTNPPPTNPPPPNPPPPPVPTSTVPEPGTLVLVVAGAVPLVIGAVRGRRRRTPPAR